jgi:hypothetical protein
MYKFSNITHTVQLVLCALLPKLRLYEKNQAINPQQKSKIKKDSTRKAVLNLPAERHHYASAIFHISSQSSFSPRRLKEKNTSEMDKPLTLSLPN